jgi:hypothetical protein
VYHVVPRNLLARFDVIEIWNTKYDHDYSPHSLNLDYAQKNVANRYSIIISPTKSRLVIVPCNSIA